MALDTYAELKTEVAAWLHRNDLTDRIPTFIEFATNRLSRSITSPRMEASTTLSVVNGVASIPSNFRAAVSMTLGTVEYKAITAADLRAMDQGGIRPTYPVYSIVNNQFKLYPADSSSPTLIYVVQLTNLVADADTNWVLQDYPDVYLMAALAEDPVEARDLIGTGQELGIAIEEIVLVGTTQGGVLPGQCNRQSSILPVSGDGIYVRFPRTGLARIWTNFFRRKWLTMAA